MHQPIVHYERERAVPLCSLHVLIRLGSGHRTGLRTLEMPNENDINNSLSVSHCRSHLNAKVSVSTMENGQFSIEKNIQIAWARLIKEFFNLIFAISRCGAVAWFTPPKHSSAAKRQTVANVNSTELQKQSTTILSHRIAPLHTQTVTHQLVQTLLMCDVRCAQTI